MVNQKQMMAQIRTKLFQVVMKLAVFGQFSLLIILMCTAEVSVTPSIGVQEIAETRCPSGYYGYNCYHHCHCRNRSECVDATTVRRCPGGCATGWSGSSCQSRNIAFGRPTACSRCPSRRSQSAVDGKSNTCVTTANGSAGWIRVNLQTLATVYYVTLNTDGRSARGWQLYVTEFRDFYWSIPCATVRTQGQRVQMSCGSPSSGRHLTILNTRGPVSVCEIQVHVCADYSFGEECNMSCQCADASEICHPLTGHCQTGCSSGFTGGNCQEECSRRYGSNCVIPCGHCANDEACGAVTGACPDVCQPGWSGERCDIVCADYSFGEECNMSCQCADASEICHPLTGHCQTGCSSGFTGGNCQEECSRRYGSNCVSPCGHCSNDEACDAVTGACPDVCQPGWSGERCDIACGNDRYGPGCAMNCGRCQGDVPCAADTGVCPGTCQTGWQGQRCDQACDNGTYGLSCHFPCGHCWTGSTCNATTGICPKGCDSGWEGLFCTQECLPHNYGVNCLLECPYCLTSCDSNSGRCDHSGCVAGRKGELCDHDCASGFYGFNCSSKCGHCVTEQCDVSNGTCPDSWCQPGWDGAHCDRPCPSRKYGINCSLECGFCGGSDVCDPVTGICPGDCQQGFYGQMCQTISVVVDTTSKTSVILIASVLTAVLSTLVLLAICLVWKRRRERLRQRIEGGFKNLEGIKQILQ